MERSRSVGKAGESRAYGGQARVMSSAVACHDLTNAAVVTEEQELMTLAGPLGESWIALPSASAIAPWLFARWPLARSWLEAGGRLTALALGNEAALRLVPKHFEQRELDF